jgi:hypothetical protein
VDRVRIAERHGRNRNHCSKYDAQTATDASTTLPLA